MEFVPVGRTKSEKPNEMCLQELKKPGRNQNHSTS